MKRSTLGFFIVHDLERAAVLALGRNVAIDELDESQRGGVAVAEAGLQNAGIATRTRL